MSTRPRLATQLMFGTMFSSTYRSLQIHKMSKLGIITVMVFMSMSIMSEAIKVMWWLMSCSRPIWESPALHLTPASSNAHLSNRKNIFFSTKSFSQFWPKQGVKSKSKDYLMVSNAEISFPLQKNEIITVDIISKSHMILLLFNSLFCY